MRKFLVMEMSDKTCFEGLTWGTREVGMVWVDRGCRATFVDTSRGVGLIRQTSDAECVLNRTWGYDRNGIWVTNGCRAEFAVAR